MGTGRGVSEAADSDAGMGGVSVFRLDSAIDSPGVWKEDVFSTRGTGLVGAGVVVASVCWLRRVRSQMAA